MDGGAWWAAVHRVAKSQTRLSDFPFTFHFHALEKEMATHSSVLAWRIPGTGEHGGLPSLGSHKVGLKRLSSSSSSSSVQSLSCVRLFAIPWTVACQVLLSMAFSRQEDWSGLPFPYPGNLPNPRIALHADSLPLSHWGSRLHDDTSQFQPAMFQVLCLLERCIIHFVIT